MYFMKEMMYTQNIYSITEDMQWVEFFFYTLYIQAVSTEFKCKFRAA